MGRSSSEKVLYETRRHGIVLAGSLSRALVLAAAGIALVAIGWPYSAAGVVVMAVAALIALRAVWCWDRTKIVLTSDQFYVVSGVLGRRSATVRLSALGAVEFEQTLLGRLLRYGTLTVGELEVAFLPEPEELYELVMGLTGSRLAA